MNNVLFSIAAYVFMRAFEVLFSDQKDKRWYRTTIRVIACAVLYTAIASMIGFYCSGPHLLGFDPK
jgi:uncharacterized membrane protein